MIMGNADRPELGDGSPQSFCSIDPRSRATSRTSRSSPTTGATSRESSVPTLVMQCTDDAIAPVEVGRYVHEADPGQPLTVLSRPPGTSRSSRVPDEVVAAIRALPRMTRLRLREALSASACGLLSTTPAGRHPRGQRHAARLDRASGRSRSSAPAFTSLLDAGSQLFYETRHAQALHLQGERQGSRAHPGAADGSRLSGARQLRAASRRGRRRSCAPRVFDATERLRVRDANCCDARRSAESSEERVRHPAGRLQHVRGQRQRRRASPSPSRSSPGGIRGDGDRGAAPG